MDWSLPVQAILFALFAALSGALWAVIAPTYDYLLVPELQPSALFPPLSTPSGPPTFLSEAASFSSFLVLHLVDPALVLVALGVGLIYLARTFLPSLARRSEGILPRLVVAALLANFTLPIARGILGLAAATYPVVAGFDGGAWQDWSRLDSVGSANFTWDNGAVAFIVSVVLFSLVFGLTLLVALRDALLGVLLVVLPLFTILWPIPTLAPLARRVWWLFGSLAFLPCLLVIPLELAVGSSSILLLLGFLTVAVSVPALLGVAGNQLSAVGFPGAGAFLGSGLRQGLGSASQGISRVFGPLAQLRGGRLAQGLGSVTRTASGAALPVTFPLIAADMVGKGAAHLVRHLPSIAARLTGPSSKFPTVERGPPGDP